MVVRASVGDGGALYDRFVEFGAKSVDVSAVNVEVLVDNEAGKYLSFV